MPNHPFAPGRTAAICSRASSLFPKPGRLCRTLPALPLLASLAFLPGCALFGERTPQVVDNKEYARLVRTFPKQMQAQGLADDKLYYEDHGQPEGRFGDRMFKQLSPDFLNNETAHHVYLGSDFHATLTPKSRVYPDRDGQGFAIVHPTQRLAMRMLALVDWNRDNHTDWLMRCTVESFRGNRVRHYYVLAPAPEGSGMTHGSIMAVVVDNGPAAAGLEVRDMAGYGQGEAIPPTIVEDRLPGDAPVTTPPSLEKPQSGVQERDI